ncbi:MAG: GTP-binding protein [Clostridia bacterium]|nr:GTP-binding protein [Clostridia bacterium]
MSNKVVPITLLTGYLGAGKTTLMNHVLNNQKGYKVAVIVNDIGEVNIDADLIAKGGYVQEEDSSLVPLSNGCICCTLKVDLMQQIADLVKTGKFDYILIEASGICEPLPIAQTITALAEDAAQYGLPTICRLDNLVTVVDAMRLRDEFGCGDNLVKEDIEEEDIENLLIQQIEFCNKIVLNKVDELSEEELKKVKAIIRELQPKAEIIETNYSKVDVDKILDTNSFNFQEASMSAGWIAELNSTENEHDEDEEEHEHHHHDHDDDDDEDEHEHHHHDHDDDEDGEHEHHGHHHHHHHHDHDEGEAEEYGIGTFVYYRRTPFDKYAFDTFAQNMPKSIIRCKGVLWFEDEPESSYVFEQSGKQVQAFCAGQWVASFSEEEQKQIVAQNPDVLRDWDPEYGDRVVKLVFIGQKMDKEKIIADLDACMKK